MRRECDNETKQGEYAGREYEPGAEMKNRLAD
jgi:hypothetical protein